MSTDGQIPGQLHIPTAAPAPASMTRAQVAEALQASDATQERVEIYADRCFTEPVDPTHLQATTDGMIQ